MVGVVALAAVAGARVYAMNVSEKEAAQQAALEAARPVGPLGMPALPKGMSTLVASRPAGGGITSGRIAEKDLAGATGALATTP